MCAGARVSSNVVNVASALRMDAVMTALVLEETVSIGCMRYFVDDVFSSACNLFEMMLTFHKILACHTEILTACFEFVA